MSWNEHKIKKMRDLWAEGKTAKEIGIEIGKSRSSVLSKIRRLGLQRKLDPNNENTRSAQGKLNSKQRYEPSDNYKVKKRKPYRPSAERMAIANKAYGEPSSLADLKNSQCCWPIGDPKDDDFHFCGAKRENKDKKYCSHHNDLAYNGVKGMNVDENIS